MKSASITISRRRFLQRASIAAAAGIAAPMVLPSRSWGAAAPSNRVSVAHVGVGGQGSGLLRGFLGVAQGQSVAICDAFKDRREAAAGRVDERYAAIFGRGTYKACKAYADFRDVLSRGDVDAVVVATPDHWHVPIALAAVRAGKDVYVEKPLGISMEHDKAMRAAVHRHGAVFQYGTQQRSFSPHCAFACELVRNGYIGQLQAIHVVAPTGAMGGKPDPQPLPEGLDYDMWLGPAPVMPYTRDRVFGVGRFHIYDYALGFIAGWGAHPLDIAHWGYPFIPAEYRGTGNIPTEGLFDTLTRWNVQGRYASGVEFSFTDGPDSTTFVGSEGRLTASRARISAEPASLLKVIIKPNEIHLLQDVHHYRDFIACVASRKTPASNIDSAVQSDFISHLGDIAIRLGRTIRWDSEKETIVGDDAALRMMRRPMRGPWTL
jgi:predicted dehydrogenase